jgi:hypothetical protein
MRSETYSKALKYIIPTSFICGVISAFLHDFYPKYEGFWSLFFAMCIVGAVVSVILFVAFLESKESN